MKKYELTEKTRIDGDVTLHRIRAVKDFTLVDGTAVHAGDLGGWIEKEENLSQHGLAWVYGDAWVYGNAWVTGKATVDGNARVYGNAWVAGKATVDGNARVFGEATVSGNAAVSGDAWVSGNAKVSGETAMSGDAWVYGNATVSGNAKVSGEAHYLCVGPVGSRKAFTTFFRTKNLEIYVSCGCFLGNINAFRKKVKETHGDNKYAKVYLLAADLAEAQINLKEATA